MVHTATLLVHPTPLAINVPVYVSQIVGMKHVTMFMDVWKVTPQKPRQTQVK